MGDKSSAFLLFPIQHFGLFYTPERGGKGEMDMRLQHLPMSVSGAAPQLPCNSTIRKRVRQKARLMMPRPKVQYTPILARRLICSLWRIRNGNAKTTSWVSRLSYGCIYSHSVRFSVRNAIGGLLNISEEKWNAHGTRKVVKISAREHASGPSDL